MSRTRFFRSGGKPQGDPLTAINHHHTLLKAQEVADTMQPLRDGFSLMRAGVATYDNYVVVYTIFRIANEIEKQGVVRGLAEHIQQALQACDSYYRRCMCADVWTAHELEFSELDAMASMIELHEFQLKQLTLAELHAAARKLIARTQSTGGEVYRADIDLKNMKPMQQQKQGVPA